MTFNMFSWRCASFWATERRKGGFGQGAHCIAGHGFIQFQVSHRMSSYFPYLTASIIYIGCSSNVQLLQISQEDVSILRVSIKKFSKTGCHRYFAFEYWSGADKSRIFKNTENWCWKHLQTKNAYLRSWRGNVSSYLRRREKANKNSSAWILSRYNIQKMKSRNLRTWSIERKKIIGASAGQKQLPTTNSVSVKAAILLSTTQRSDVEDRDI